MRLARRLGQVIGGVGLCALLVASDCQFRFGPPPDCWEGLRVGEIVELELLEPYTRETRYAWIDHLDPARVGLPTCSGRDGLVPGTYRFRVSSASNLGERCIMYAVVPLTPLIDVDVNPETRPTGGVVSVQGLYRGAYWQMQALRDPDQGLDPFGEEAIAGQRPPLVAQRYIWGDFRCFDQWAAEIRHADADAGAAATDGGS